jgi:hypothetical protein
MRSRFRAQLAQVGHDVRVPDGGLAPELRHCSGRRSVPPGPTVSPWPGHS